MNRWKSNFGMKVSSERFMTNIQGYPRHSSFDTADITALLLIGLFVLVGVIVIIALIFQDMETNKHCGLWERKMVHQNAYTTFIWSGKIMIPIYHPAGDYERTVCTQPK